MSALANGTVNAMVAVNDQSAAKDFYGGKLELKQVDENPGGVMYESGGGKIFVYQSSTAGSGKATCASWTVQDVNAAVEELKSKGVSFDKYDVPGTTWEGDVAVMGPMKVAWFKDPDGNILSITSA